MGLGLSRTEFWDSTHREIAARRKIWEDQRQFQVTMFAQIRADIYNSSEMLKRSDKRQWEASDFGAKTDPKKWKHPRNTLTPEELQRRLSMSYSFGNSHGPASKTPTIDAAKSQAVRFDPHVN